MKYQYFIALLLFICTSGLKGQIHIEDGVTLYLQTNGTVYTTGSTTVNGTLAGTGTITSSNVNLGATGKVSPGASVGTLNVGGNLNFGSGTYVCEIDGSSSFDVINVTNGTATIDNLNSNLDVTFGYNPSLSSTFQIIIGTSSGNFGNFNIMGGGVNAVSGGALLSITVLPIELVSFTAIERQGQVQMNWKTATEQSNTGFEIQRASDAYFDQWDKLGFVKGQGTIYTEQHYSFVDPQPINGINYYRLKQIDFDGSHEFSNVVSVSRTNKLKQIQFYPNPANGSTTLFIDSDFIGTASLKLFDQIGKQLNSQLIELTGQPHRMAIDLSHFTAGVYLVEIEAGNEKWQERVWVK